MNLDQLNAIVGNFKSIAKFVDPLNAAMDEFIIDTPLRIAAFIAQIAHESGSFVYVKEIASGRAYEGREDLGNVEQGDGVKYKGRGLIQITGRSNYKACGDTLGVDLINKPEMLETPDLACRSAGWFWASRGLNDLADEMDFKKITKRINGGYNGLAHREELYNKAIKILS